MTFWLGRGHNQSVLNMNTQRDTQLLGEKYKKDNDVLKKKKKKTCRPKHVKITSSIHSNQ